MKRKKKQHQLTMAYEQSVNKLCKAARNNIPGSEYLADVTNDCLYIMAVAADALDMYPAMIIEPQIVAQCKNGAFAVCRERLQLAVCMYS